MLKSNEYHVGTLVELKKQHPSGTIVWTIVRTGIDVKLQSTDNRNLYITMDRIKFNNRVAKIVKN